MADAAHLHGPFRPRAPANATHQRSCDEHALTPHPHGVRGTLGDRDGRAGLRRRAPVPVGTGDEPGGRDRSGLPGERRGRAGARDRRRGLAALAAAAGRGRLRRGDARAVRGPRDHLERGGRDFGGGRGDRDRARDRRVACGAPSASGRAWSRASTQAWTTWSPSTFTLKASSGRGAGPLTFAPVAASNTDPWHGQVSCAPSGATVQPMWVQMALNPTTVPASGWAMITESPAASVAETAPRPARRPGRPGFRWSRRVAASSRRTKIPPTASMPPRPRRRPRQPYRSARSGGRAARSGPPR